MSYVGSALKGPDSSCKRNKDVWINILMAKYNTHEVGKKPIRHSGTFMCPLVSSIAVLTCGQV